MIVTKTKNFQKILNDLSVLQNSLLPGIFASSKCDWTFFLPPFSLKLYATYGKPIWYFCFKETSTVKKPDNFQKILNNLSVLP